MATQIVAVLKSEITRLARKEIRAEVASLKKASAQQRSTIAALRREIDSLQKRVRAAAKSRPEAAEREDEGVRHRFRRDGLITHRKTLGLSAEDYGKLVGVTGQSIYKWENGTRPRASQLASLAAVRKMGKREAAKRLEEIEAASAPKRAAKKRGRKKA